ncbi:MAG: AI-2E family transporter [Acidobacteriota bacterium]
METHRFTVRAISSSVASEPGVVTPERKRGLPLSWIRSVRGLLILATFLFLREAAAILVPVTIAVALMFVLTGPVQYLRRKGIPEAWGSGIVVGVLLTVLILLGTSLASPAADWVERAPTTVKQMLDTIDKVRATITPPTTHRARVVPANEPDPIKDKLASEGVILTRVIVGHFFSFTLSAAATIILLYFLLASQPWLLSRTVEVARKPRQRALLLSGIRQAQRDIGRFLGTMALINVAVGICTGIALKFVGLPNPVLWATVIAVLNFIPYLGPALVTGMLLLAGSMTFGASTAMLAPPAAFLICHGIEANLVSPWVLGRRLGLSPLAVFLSVMLWGWVWGFAGTLVAVPILLGFRALCQRRRSLKSICFYLEGGHTQAPTLAALLKPRDRPRPRPRINKVR